MARKDLGDQERERVRQLIRARFCTQLAACSDLHAVVINVIAQRTPLSAPAETAAGPAVMFLFGKILRSFNATRILVYEGYGPDAMVVARSLVNATIDLGYIGAADSEERARQWSAVGVKAQREYLAQDGKVPDGNEDLSWAKIEARTKLWKALKIERRAELVGLGDLYQIAYRAGSSPEHSDSWSSTHYLYEIPGGGLGFQIGPSENGVANALSMACWGMSEAFLRWCRFFEFDEDAATQRVTEIANQFSRSLDRKDGC